MERISNDEYHQRLGRAMRSANMASHRADRTTPKDIRWFMSALNDGTEYASKKELPTGVIQLFHRLEVPCNERGSSQEAECFCIKHDPNDYEEVEYWHGKHLRGECPHLPISKRPWQKSDIIQIEGNYYLLANIGNASSTPTFILASLEGDGTHWSTPGTLKELQERWSDKATVISNFQFHTISKALEDLLK